MSSLPDNVSRLLGRSRFGDCGVWMFDRIAEGIAPRPLATDRHRALRERVMANVTQRQSSCQTVRAADGEWRSLAPGVTIKLLHTDAAAEQMTAFIRMAPGSSLESHAHAQREECLVIEGEIFIGEHRVRVGDLHVAAAGTVHDIIRSPHGALLLVHAQNLLAR